MKTEFLGASNNGVFCVDGVDLFQLKWQTTGKCAVVLEPGSKTPYTFSVYEAQQGERSFCFAAGELRPGEWSFYEMVEE
ncbi:MAG TPA: hypothetical protein IAA58_13220 [Candidatus Gallacutalibacter stercoravium]|nr:hypothetical protein [Candidatus Gallacutalibacter stercoravium]